MKSISLRRLSASDLPWVNARYAGISFALSRDVDLMVSVDMDGKSVGLGRLVPLEDGSAEMGGIHVLPEYRRHRIASRIVDYLIEISPYPRLYCIPFTPLEPFYRRFGFDTPAAGLALPGEVRAKMAWCEGRYPDPVCLLVRDPPQGPR
jgi:GNAT superfamily N-acetyltransferase